MFQRVHINHFDYTVKIIDSNFTEIVSAREIDICGCMFIPEIISVYRSRKLNVADALARYIYSNLLNDVSDEALTDIRNVARIVRIDYAKYHNCVVNRIKYLRWSHPKNFTKPLRMR